MGLATEAGESTGSPLPLGEAATKLYMKIIESEPELATKDFSSVYKYLQKLQ